MNATKKKNKSAFTLVLVMVIMVILFATTTGILALGYSATIHSRMISSNITARTATDAGLTKAIREMNKKLSDGSLDDNNLPTETNVQLPGSDQYYSYTIAGTSATGYTVTSTGFYSTSQKKIQCRLKAQTPFQWAIFAEENILLRNSAQILSDDGQKVKVATNSTADRSVDLRNSAKIKGDVAVGYGSEPTEVIRTMHSASITGDTYALPQAVTIPAASVPSGFNSGPGTNINNSQAISTSGTYQAINLGNSKKLTVSGDVTLHIEGDIDLGNSASIELEENSSLTIYLGGELTANNSAQINNKTQDPKKLKIYGLENCTSMDFRNSSTFYGIIYAPQADLIFRNSIDIYGSIICKSMDFKNSSTLHYDGTIQSMPSNLTSFKISRWREY